MRTHPGALPSILVYHSTHAKMYADALEHLGIAAHAAHSVEEALPVIQDAEVILGWGMPRELLQQAIRLRWIQSTGAGVDHIMRHRDVLSEDVVVTRVLDQYGPPMAEYVFAHLLYLYKDLARMQDASQRQCWDPFHPDGLSGKIIGIAGLGSIGSEIIRKARAFDMVVHGLSASGRYSALVDKHYGPDEWATFVRQLDVLVTVLPLTPSTKGVISANVLSAMKPDAVFVNVGRGGLVDETALVTRMQQKGLRAAVLDVFEEEPLPPSHPLWTLENVYVTPHISGVSSIPDVSRYFAENVDLYLEREPLRGQVDMARGY